MRAVPVILLPALWKMMMGFEVNAIQPQVNVIQPPYLRSASIRDLVFVKQPSFSFLSLASLKVQNEILVRRCKLFVHVSLSVSVFVSVSASLCCLCRCVCVFV